MNRLNYIGNRSDLTLELLTEATPRWVWGFVLYTLFKTPDKLHKLYKYWPPHRGSDTPADWVLFFCMVALVAITSLLLVVWLLWGWKGREVIEVDGDTLFIKYTIGKLAITRKYWIRHIENLRVDVKKNPLHSIASGGNITFDYEKKRHRFGWTLNADDAGEVVTAIKPYLAEKVLNIFSAA